MTVWPVTHLSRVEHSSGGARKSDSLLRARHHGDEPAAERTLRKVRGFVRAPAPDFLDRLPHSDRRPVGAALVVTDDGANVRIVGEGGRATGSGEDVDRPAPGQLGDERRRENDVAEN